MEDMEPVSYTHLDVYKRQGVNLAMGGVTPPYASILYLGMRIGKAEFHEILKPTMTFLILGYVPIVFLVTYWPDLALAIPRMAGFAV